LPKRIELPDKWHVEVPYTLDDAREAARYLLSLDDRPTAVVCGNESSPTACCWKPSAAVFAVPRDLSVVGFDDLDWSRHLRPSLTTISRSHRRDLATRRRISGPAAGRRADHHASRDRLLARRSRVVRPASAPETTRTIAMTSTFSLAQGFHAVVIGGAGDIGAAISKLFCELGATVTATAVNEATLPARRLSRGRGLN